MSRPRWKKGRTESPGDAAERCSAGAAGLQPAWSCCGIERPARWLTGEHSVDAASAATAACSKPGEPLVAVRKADPACAARALVARPSSGCPADEAFPDRMGVQSGQRWAYAGV